MSFGPIRLQAFGVLICVKMDQSGIRGGDSYLSISQLPSDLENTLSLPIRAVVTNQWSAGYWWAIRSERLVTTALENEDLSAFPWCKLHSGGVFTAVLYHY